MVACGVTAFVNMGIAVGFGSVYLDIMDAYSTTRPLAALVQSLCLGVGFGASVVTGPLVTSFGPARVMITGSIVMTLGFVGSFLSTSIHMLIVTHGVLTGIGISFCYLSAQVIVGTTFHHIRHLALPSLMVCAGLGSSAFPQLLRVLVEVFSVRGMYLIVGGISLHILVCGVVIEVFGSPMEYGRENNAASEAAPEEEVAGSRNEPARSSAVESASETPRSPNDKSFGRIQRGLASAAVAFRPELARNTNYVLLTVFSNTVRLTFQGPGLFMMDMATGAGLSVEEGTALLSVMFCCNVGGQVLLGVIQGFRRVSTLFLYSTALVSTGAAAFCFTLVHKLEGGQLFTAYMLVCAFFGLFYGVMACCGPLTCLELVESHYYPTALGYQYFVIGICGAVCGPLGGYLKEATGSYDSIFYLALAEGCAGGIATGLVALRKRSQSSKGRSMCDIAEIPE